MCSASVGRPKKSLLSSFPLLPMGVVAGTMVANSVGLIDRILLGERNIWILASYHPGLLCLVLHKLYATGVHDVRICVVDSLLEWHILHVSSIC